MKDGVVLSEAGLRSSGFELRKLHSMISLMKFNDAGILLVKVLKRRGKWTRDVMVCPFTLRSHITLDTHQQNHQDYSRTLSRLKLDWLWPGMTAMVKRVVKTCDTCQKGMKASKKVGTGDVNLCVGRPWQQVTVDLVGPMPTTLRVTSWFLF